MSSEPRLLRLRASTRLIIGAVAFAVFTDMFLYGIVVPVIPTALEQRVHLPPGNRQRWTSALLAIYAAGLLIASPVFGLIADQTNSRRVPLLFGLIAFAAATALLCVGTNLGLWISGRLFQGISAAMVWTVSLALLVDTVNETQIGKAMGVIGTAISVGTMLGPLLGGVLYQHGGYYSVFGLAFGVIAIDLLLRLAMIEKRHAEKWLSTPSAMSETAHSSTRQQESQALRDGVTRGQVAGGYRSTKSQVQVGHLQPILVLVRSPRMAITLFAYFVMASLMTAFDSVLPLFVKETFGWGQTGEGLIFVPLFLPHFLEPLAGAVLDRFPASGRYLTAGSLLGMTPFLVLLRLVTHDSIEQKILLSALLILIGLTFAAGLPPLLVEISYLIAAKEKEHQGIFGAHGAVAQGYGLFNCAFAAGSLVGPIWAGMIRDEYGWGTMSWSLGVLSSFASVPTLLFLGGSIYSKS
ncbi:MFS transporter [Aspergillus caelatus]|uniref:MFS transporter n=1 Tax=Aspergillus caelatus TaxID=61420 RepID=A0A5N7ALL6_9EURO|nr:MFS transporter [Aspergillus caelatus]KAE8370705.1 MFS transporter [Aspergillus caelatus]